MIRLRVQGAAAAKRDLDTTAKSVRTFGDSMGRLRDERGRLVAEGGRITGRLRGLARALPGGAAGMRMLASAADSARSAVTGAKVAITAATVAAGALGVSGIKAGLQFNAAFESAEVSFSTLLGSAERARRFMRDLQQVSDSTTLRFTEAMDASVRLLGMGFGPREAIRTLRALNMAMIGGGRTVDEFNRASLALGQIMAKNKVSQEELLQLTEAGFPVYDILRRKLGLTRDELADIARSGIGARRAIRAIAEGWEEKFGTAARRAERTWRVQTMLLTKDWEKFQRVVTAPLFRRLSRDVLPWLRRGLRFGIAGMDRGGLAGMFAGLDRGFKAGGRIVAAYTAVASAVRDTAATVRDWLIPAAKASIKWLAALPKEAKLAFAGVAAAAALAFGGPLAWLAALGAAVVLVHKHWRTIRRAGQAAARWVQGAWRDTLAWLSDRFGITVDDVKQAWQAVQNVAKATALVAREVWERYLFTALKRGFDGLKQVVRGAMTFIGGLVKLVTGVLTGDFGKAWSGVKQMARGAIDFMIGAFKMLTAPIRSAMDAVVGVVKDAFGAVIRFIEARINNVIDLINAMIKAYNKLPGPDIGLIDYIGAKGERQQRQRFEAGKSHISQYRMPRLRRGTSPFAPLPVLPGPALAGASSSRTLNLNVGVNLDGRQVGRGVVRHIEDDEQWR